MNFTYSKKELKNAISVGGKFCNGSKVMQILECVCINIDETGKTTIMSTDLENSIYATVNAAEHDGTKAQFCVNGTDFDKCISLISDENVSIEYNDGDTSVKVKHSTGASEMPTFPFNEFPKMKLEGDPVSFSVYAYELMNIINDGQKFVSNEELRPTFNTMSFNLRDGESQIECCTTDAHSLFNDKINIISSEPISQTDFMIPAKAFQSIINICNSEIKANGNESTIKVKVYSDKVLFSVEKCKLISQKAEGRFPNYSSIIQNIKEHDIKASVNVNDFTMSIKRVGISSASNGLVKLDFASSGKLDLVAENVDFGKKSYDSIGCETSSDITIGVSANLMLRCLSVLSEQNVTVMMKNDRSAIVFKEESSPSRIVLVMPLMI